MKMNTYAGAKLSLRELATPTCLALATSAAPIFFYEGPLERPLAMAAAISFLGFFVVVWIIPRVTHKFPACLQGKDLGKAGTPHSETKVPEGVGLISGGVQIMCLVFVMVFCRIPRDGSILGSGEGCPNNLPDDEHTGALCAKLQGAYRDVEYNSAVVSLCLGLLLGFADDVLDIPWRYKLVLPFIASLPLILSYHGLTDIVVPGIFRSLIVQQHPHDDGSFELTRAGSLLSYLVDIDVGSGGAIIGLGSLYLVYMLLLSIFCTNSINILAGINGLEAGQAVVIGSAIIIMNVLELTQEKDPVYFTGNNAQHYLALLIMMPFVATTYGLLAYNWFPARVFVGDTFTHSAGMTLAVAAILGHFSKTLLLLFVPQILNFIMSLPQLAKVIPCPRHRLPHYNAATGLMEPSYVNTRKQIVPEDRNCMNLTLINLVLRICGPMREATLCSVLILLQCVSCGVGLYVRYSLASLAFSSSDGSLHTGEL